MTTHDESPIIRTTKKAGPRPCDHRDYTCSRAGIAVPFWNQMAQTPPPASTIVIESPAPPEGKMKFKKEHKKLKGGNGRSCHGRSWALSGTAAGTTITILSGSSVQGNPDYEPDDADVPLNENVVWVNEDTTTHSNIRYRAEDPNSGKNFDTSIINAGENHLLFNSQE